MNKTENNVTADQVQPQARPTNEQRMAAQLARFFRQVQSAEANGETSYRSLLNHFKTLSIDGRSAEYVFDAMQILYGGTPEDDERQYSDREMQAFFATLRLYALGYCTQNRTPNAFKPRLGEQYPDTFATSCARFARQTKTQEWCNARIAGFLNSRTMAANFRYLENIVSRMGKSGYEFDYIRMFKDLNLMFSKNKALGTDICKRWAEQYVRTVNKIALTAPSNENE